MRVVVRNLSRSRQQEGSRRMPWVYRTALLYRSRTGIRDESPLLGRPYGPILLSILGIVISWNFLPDAPKQVNNFRAAPNHQTFDER